MSSLLRFLSVSVLLTGLLTGRLPVLAQTPTKQWDKTYGGSGADHLAAMQPTPDGGFILAGYSASDRSGDKAQPNLGGVDCWVVKLDASGTKQWDRTFGGSDNEYVGDVQATSDGGYILLGYSASSSSGDKTQAHLGGYDYWVLKLDAHGVKEWDKTYGGSGAETGLKVRQTRDGGYLLGGSSESGSNGDKTQPSQGQTDCWLVKLDANGTKQWDKTFGGSRQDYFGNVQQTSDGGYLLGVSSSSPSSGDKTQDNFGSYDYWVVKLDATGTKQWDQTFGGSMIDYLSAVLPTNDGGYLLAGSSASGSNGDKTQPNKGASTTTDFWLVKLDATGSKQWDKTIGGNASDSPQAVHPTRDGGYLLGGNSDSGSSGDKSEPTRGQGDYWVVKVDASGTKQWDTTVGGNSTDFLRTLHPTLDGGYVLGGWSDSGSGGEKTQPSQGGNDYWVVKLTESPLATTSATARQPLAVYPNPTQTSLTLRLADDAPRAGLHLSLLEATGRVVLRLPLPAATRAEVPVQVGQQPAGLYLLRLEGPDGYLATQHLQLQ